MQFKIILGYLFLILIPPVGMVLLWSAKVKHRMPLMGLGLALSVAYVPLIMVLYEEFDKERNAQLAESNYQLAEQYYQKGEYESARQIYEYELYNNPYNTHPTETFSRITEVKELINFEYYQTVEKTGRLQDCLEYYHQFSTQNPLQTPLLEKYKQKAKNRVKFLVDSILETGKTAISKQKYKDAYEIYNMIPQNIPAYKATDLERNQVAFQAGIEYEKEGNNQRAISIYHSIPKSHPKYTLARQNADKILIKLGNEQQKNLDETVFKDISIYEKAIEYYMKVDSFGSYFKDAQKQIQLMESDIAGQKGEKAYNAQHYHQALDFYNNVSSNSPNYKIAKRDIENIKGHIKTEEEVSKDIKKRAYDDVKENLVEIMIKYKDYSIILSANSEGTQTYLAIVFPPNEAPKKIRIVNKPVSDETAKYFFYVNGSEIMSCKNGNITQLITQAGFSQIIDNQKYGAWKKEGIYEFWKFHDKYQTLSDMLGIGNYFVYRDGYEFYRKYYAGKHHYFGSLYAPISTNSIKRKHPRYVKVTTRFKGKDYSDYMAEMDARQQAENEYYEEEEEY